MNRLLTVREVAEVLRCAESTVYRAIQGGRLPAWRYGRMVRVREADLERFVEGAMVTEAEGALRSGGIPAGFVARPGAVGREVYDYGIYFDHSGPVEKNQVRE
jgi:excisionase family DNA binding protein